MYVRIVKAVLGPRQRDVAQKIADELSPHIEEQPGCQGVTVFADDHAGEYGLIVFWDTKENAEAAAAIIRPQLDEHLVGHAQGPPDTHLYRVLSH
jgi:heme-degrading monooxygenase HmoA